MSSVSLKGQVVAELRAGHLGVAMKLVEENRIPIDQELRQEAVRACEGSLRRHFHWIIPAFIATFQIKDDDHLKALAGKIVHGAIAHGQPVLAGAVAQTFGIQLDQNAKATIQSAVGGVVKQIEQATGAIVIQDDGGEYAFDLDGDTSIAAEAILVPAGEFVMGTSDEQYRIVQQAFPCDRPQRRVHVDAFYIDKYPVTNAAFAEFTQATGYAAEGTRYGKWDKYAGPGRAKHPVVSVSWADIEAYCRWASKRLPTEAEWEKASRGTDGRIWPWGNQWDPAKCNSRESGIGHTTPVDQYETGSSPYGCFDMIGNVWELVSDWLSLDYYATGPTRNPKGPATGSTHVMRGGAFSTRADCCRCAFRIGPDSSTQLDRVGFRCARSA